MSQSSVLPTGKLPLEMLQQLLGRYAQSDPRLIAGPGIGEDVAVVDMGDRYLVIKTDPITFATEQIGWYAVHVNANDIATSGATPLWMLNTILLPEGKTTRDLADSILYQLHEACVSLGIVLVGGHTEITWGLDRPIVVGVMIGEVAKDRLITTAGARVGDEIVVVKSIPIEATAIIAQEKADDLRARGYNQETIQRAARYLHDPGISVMEAAKIAASAPGVHAMHDPTEGGLATGLHELACAAGAGVRMWADRVPLAPEGARLCAEYGLDPLGSIASGALIVAIAREATGDLLARYQAAGIRATIVGELTPPGEGMIMVRGGIQEPLPRFDADEITRLF